MLTVLGPLFSSWLLSVLLTLVNAVFLLHPHRMRVDKANLCVKRGGLPIFPLTVS